MRSYILKEYGSWSVLIMSYTAGLLAARSSGIEPIHFLPLLTLALIMNSKQAFTLWIKKRPAPTHLSVFFLQLLVATVLLILQFGKDLLILLPLMSIPVLYLALLIFRGEHFIVTEALGFAVLTLATPVAAFTVMNEISMTLYLAAFLFFTAGVFKVRIFLKKKAFDRIAMVIYVIIACAVFFFARIPLALLLPLTENIYFALFVPKVKLSTVGWTEVLKGIIFLILTGMLLT